ncbi:MAG: ABC transporter ATP-binding protein [Flavobacteriales bacterium]|nr:ABC transporter ATP-binding protein [Flavobacteriales bacterium]
MKKFWEIFAYTRNYRINLLGSAVFSILNAVLSLFTFGALIPLLRVIFQTGAENPQPPADDLGFFDYYYQWFCYQMDVMVSDGGAVRALAYICLATVVLALIKNLVFYVSLRNIAVIRTGVARDLRKRVYEHITKLSLGYFSNERKGDIISRMTNDLMEVEFSVIGTIEVMFKAPIMIVFYLATLFIMSWELTLFALIFLPISGFLISRIAKSLKHAAKHGKDKLGELISVIEETLGGIRVIKAFNGEKAFNQKFDDHNESYFRLMNKLYKREYLSSPMSEFVSLVVICILLYIGGSIVLGDQSTMDGSLFITYLVIFSQIIPPARALSDAIFKINKGAASVDRINEILHAPIDVANHPDAVRKPDFEQAIELHNVGFAYEDKQVIKDVSLTIRKGETVALVGPSGGGKSTLANLVARFYNVSSGEVTIDGVPIARVDLHDLRSLMGIVTQESILFNDSVGSNITLGSDAPKADEMMRAAQVANAWEFIDQLDGKFEFNIGDSGNKLSGGQKQRLSIARAVYKNPPILILDEATSALDTHSEKLVQQAINNLMENRTSLVIAHRLSTIQNADRIVVIDQGQILETGTHQELMSAGGMYKRLVEMQEFD